MSEPANKSRMYKVLAIVFAVAGLVWILGGVFSDRYLLFPFIGVLNWGLALVCYQSAQMH